MKYQISGTAENEKSVFSSALTLQSYKKENFLYNSNLKFLRVSSMKRLKKPN